MITTYLVVHIIFGIVMAWAIDRNNQSREAHTIIPVCLLLSFWLIPLAFAAHHVLVACGVMKAEQR